MDAHFDLFVIGAGSGGVRAARLAAEAGVRTAIAESHRPGGTCVIRGCVPKKLMYYAANYGHMFAEAEGFGWHIPGPVYDHQRFTAALQAEIGRLSDIYAGILSAAGATLFRERAVLQDATTIHLVQSGRKIRAGKILIATGGKPRSPASMQGRAHAVTSDDMFDLDELPERLAIIGGGYIAVEFAGIMSGLGVATSLIYRGEQILRGFDADMRAHVQGNLVRSGVRVITEARPERIGPDRLLLSTGEDIACDMTMLAVGRDPATTGLGLDRAGVALNADGAIEVDADARTSVASISAIGDVTNRVNLTPVAIREADAYARREFMGEAVRFSYENIPTAVFSSPPLAQIGLSEEAARARADGPVRVYMSRFRPLKDRLTGMEEEMVIKLVVSGGDERIVGCHVIGSDAPEIVQTVAIALGLGATKADFDRICALHPTSAEELVTLKAKD